MSKNKESQDTEWKESWRDEHIKWIAGFANANGGKLLIGVDDKGVIKGVSDAKLRLEEIPNKVRDLLGLMVDVNLLQKGTLDYLEIKVDAYPYPVSYKGQYYYRSGSTNQELKGAALDHFLLNKVGRRWDAVPLPDVSTHELNDESIATVKIQSPTSNRLPIGVDTETNEIFLQNLRLLEGASLKRAAVLLFHPEPDKYISGAYIKIGYFKTDDDLEFQDTIKGSLIMQVNKAMDLLIHKYLIGRISYTGVYRTETYPFPIEAIREALLNAVVHKDYASAVPIQISVYDDKIIFWNYGKLPEHWTTERLKHKHPSIPYNPDIPNTFFVAGLIETWGRGTIKIINECNKAGLPEPEFVSDQAEFHVTLKVAKTSGTIPNPQIDTIDAGLITGKNRLILLNIVQEISKNPSITAQELAAMVGKTVRTIERYLQQLQEIKLIKRVGPKKGGRWEIIKK